MRDYSFGNFISAQRERCGLSQYQLGALVGVSDKAVSKWENGVSKPRTGIMLKLSEVLDVSVDELLTCEYVSSNKRKDLFAMKKDILSLAECRLREIYGDNPHVIVSNRFSQEKLMLCESETLLWFGFLGKLQEKFSKEHAYFCIRGAQAGASFIAWLLNGTCVNPLPAHYYCPHCKKIEFVKGVKCGLDLENKKCECDHDYKKDGFDIDAINMYPLVQWNEINVSQNAAKLVEDVLKEYFGESGNIRKIQMCTEGQPEEYAEISVTRYGLFPKELSVQYTDENVKMSLAEFSKIRKTIPGITVVEDANDTVCIDDIMNTAFSKQQIKEFFDYSVRHGLYHGETFDRHFDRILPDIKEPKFSDLLTLAGFLHGTGVWEDNAELLYEAGIPLEQLISCREDVYSYLYEKLNNKCCLNPSGRVFEIKESVCKGKYSNNRMPAEIEENLLECGVPEWYVNSMKRIRYLFPKTHLITMLKHDICSFLNDKFR